MIRIRIEYDAYNRSFKLVDREFGAVLEDGVEYVLLLPLMLQGLETHESFELDYDIPLGHA